MGLFNFKKKRDQEQKERSLSESDKAILSEALNKGTPCIPFIPINALRQSLTVLKPEGLKGYFIVKIPTLYPDGTIRYLYKEEFMLWMAADSVVSNTESKGRTYYFLGLDQLLTKYEDFPYLDPEIFYQNNFCLHHADFQEELEFFRPKHSPLLELAFIPADHNIKFKHLHVVNFLLVANIYPLDEREDLSTIFESYEQWKDAKYPLAGKELQELLDKHIQSAKDSLLK